MMPLRHLEPGEIDEIVTEAIENIIGAVESDDDSHDIDDGDGVTV